MADNKDDNAEFDELAAQVNNTNKPIQWVDKKPSTVANMSGAIKRIRQKAFLEAFSRCGVIEDACKASGVNRATERAWRDKDAWYRDQFKDAYSRYQDLVRKAVHVRAIDGVQVPIVGKVATPFGPEDQIIGYKTQHSDLLLMFLAKKVDPTYKESHVPIDANDGRKMETVSPLTRITIHLDMVGERQTINLETGQRQLMPAAGEIIDVVPEPATDVEAEDTDGGE